MAIHAGLVCINGPEQLSAEMEVELFDLVLTELGSDDLVNQAVEITLGDQGTYELTRYDLPAPFIRSC